MKEQLKNTRLSKRWQTKIVQARTKIVQASVESALLFDCQVKAWCKRDKRRLQKWMDKCWRYV